MRVDLDLLRRFEQGLDPQNLAGSAVPAEVLGFGEISTIFEIQGSPGTAFKRMPLFRDRAAAEDYALNFSEYCGLLEKAGLTLPASETAIIEIPRRPVVLYIAQAKLPPDRMAHRLIHARDARAAEDLLERIAAEIGRIWDFNRTNRPDLELALDGQLSNWAYIEGVERPGLYYLDTSTPLYRQAGVEQLDPDLLLQAAPGFLRWIVELFFLDDVMTRYYDPRQVYIDLAANLYKEQRPDLVPAAVEVVNRARSGRIEPVTVRDVEKYYREDKLIWSLWLALRRIDRWLTTKLRRRRYEFILPAGIKR